MDREKEREKMIARLLSFGYLKSKKAADAMGKVPRERFLPREQSMRAYEDRPLEIGFCQTISAPHMVAIMTEALDVKPKHKILEIGSGSGYQAAILAELAKKGKIYTFERIEAVKKFAEENLKTSGYKNVIVLLGDGTLGYEEKAPYDRIIVTAAAPKVPQALVSQLKENGKLLIPVGGRTVQRLFLIEKNKEEIKEKNICECVFVPLIGKDGW